MAALTAERNTKKMLSSIGDRLYLKVDGGSKIYKGSLVVINAVGYAAPATAAASLTAVGRALETVDNTSGADGDKSIHVEEGIFKWANKGGDLVTQAMVGLVCTLEDDQTVRLTAAGSSVAGRVIQVDSDGVWVRSGIIGYTG